ncbi:hypothetical protein CDAR_125701 [Caerostris darwini]|uniref:Uncharacterized protein n=1 Tax=Caerostris darwini TaxID=1538125 RepID=A0AAV4TPG9_9ARAC|nr:hypothetical protein CDAR_125701 [Caerostris darwini]
MGGQSPIRAASHLLRDVIACLEPLALFDFQMKSEKSVLTRPCVPTFRQKVLRNLSACTFILKNRAFLKLHTYSKKGTQRTKSKRFTNPFHTELLRLQSPNSCIKTQNKLSIDCSQYL